MTPCFFLEKADIFNNMHGAVGKSALAKLLNQLVDQGVVHGKAYGKQWIYVISQVGYCRYGVVVFLCRKAPTHLC